MTGFPRPLLSLPANHWPSIFVACQARQRRLCRTTLLEAVYVDVLLPLIDSTPTSRISFSSRHQNAIGLYEVYYADNDVVAATDEVVTVTGR